MAQILKLYKKEGETPLQCILNFKSNNPEYTNEKMTYLGRLDPMAEGLLLVMVGNTNEKNNYLSLDKTYEFEVLWGFSTDTHDILGLVQGVSSQPVKLEQKIPKILNKIMEKKIQIYPIFSSKFFKGNFLKARDAKINELDLPEKNIKIFDIQHQNTRIVSNHELLDCIKDRIALVQGDFRQAEIIREWENVLKNDLNVMISSFRADVSSGTYIRGLAHEMGEILGKKAVAWRIKRTRIGDYILD